MWTIAFGIVMGLFLFGLITSITNLLWELMKTKEFWYGIVLIGFLVLIWLDGGWNRFTNDIGAFFINIWPVYPIILLIILVYRANLQLIKSKEAKQNKNI